MFRDITIDFYIMRLPGNKIALYSYDTKSKMNVEFKGSRFKKVTSDNGRNDSITSELPSGTIVEYEFHDDKFYPKKVRNDKSGPNMLAVAEANWGDIINPITDEDISGVNLTLVFSYHKGLRKERLSLQVILVKSCICVRYRCR